jgi:large subunit ribosomal protein L29
VKPGELRERSPQELRDDLKKLRQQLFQLQFQWQSEENPDTSHRTKIKRDIARILTILRQNEPARSASQAR